jgi:hypothetical protein
MMLLSECPNGNHAECRIMYYKGIGGVIERCMCWCHEHAKREPKEEEPPVGIHARMLADAMAEAAKKSNNTSITLKANKRLTQP